MHESKWPYHSTKDGYPTWSSIPSTNISSTYITGKQHIILFGDSTHHAQGPLDVIHTYMYEPIRAGLYAL